MFHALRRPESAILQRHRALGFDCVKGEKKGGARVGEQMRRVKVAVLGLLSAMLLWAMYNLVTPSL